MEPLPQEERLLGKEQDEMYQKLSPRSGNLLGFKIDDTTTDEDVLQMGGILSKAVVSSGKVRLLVEVEGFRRMEPDVLLQQLKFALDHAQDIERMALVSHRVWIKSWLKVGGLPMHAETEHFQRSQIDDAWEWLRR